jgi:histidinol-phosphate aminotransferase
MPAEPPSKKAKTGIASTLARPNILALHPYRCARDDYDTGILLDANENAIGPTSLPTHTDAKNPNHLVLERYPCPYQFELKNAYAAYRGHGIEAKNIFVGVGSDEAIDLLMRIFCKPGEDCIMTTPPTYGMYKVSANVNDAKIVEVPLTEDFDLKIPEMLDAVTDKVKLMFICSPGNPTCKAIPISDILQIADSPRYNGIVVVDEAYVDFSKETSAISLVKSHPNIVVLQTLSKAFGLAGIRCGFAIGNDDVIQLMNNVKAPYNVNKLTSEVAVNAMKNVDTLAVNIKTLMEERDVMVKALNELDFVVKIYPSDSNFLLVRLQQKSQEVYKQMADNGVVVRYRGGELHCKECLRITIGTKEENVSCLDLLKNTYASLTATDDEEKKAE